MKEFSIVEVKNLIKKVVDAFFEMSKRDYLEIYGLGVITLRYDSYFEIKISKPKKEQFPSFLNVEVNMGHEIMDIDLSTPILIDLCNKFGLMDQKLQWKLDAMINEKSVNVYNKDGLFNTSL